MAIPTKLLLILGLLAFSQMSLSKERNQADALFAALESANFHFLTPQECQAHLDQQRELTKELFTSVVKAKGYRIENRGLLSWTPSGVQELTQPECSRAEIESQILSSQTGLSGPEQAEAISRILNRCEKHLSRNAPASWEILLDQTNIEYNLCQHPQMRQVIINTGQGNKIRGFLAMKPSSDPRPLVIGRCGTFCNPGDPSARVMMMHFFDESPFNVLMLASNTGADYVGDNDHLALGGFDEGMHFMRLAQLIDTLPLTKYVSSLHIAGLSLGSHGALYTSYINQHVLRESRVPYFNSVLALCTVSDLQTSMNDLFIGEDPKQIFARRYFMSEFKKAWAKSPTLQLKFPDPDDIDTSKIPTVVAEASLDYYSKLDANWALPPFTGAHLSTVDTLWKMNHFPNYVEHLTATPTLSYSSLDDWVVTPEVNALDLRWRLENSANTNLGFVVMPQGNHCGTSLAYGWNTDSAIYRSYILSHSPEFNKNKHTKLVPSQTLANLSAGIATSGEHYSRLEFLADAKTQSLKVNFDIWSPPTGWFAPKCDSENPYEASSRCFRKLSVAVPLAEFNFFDKPINQTEAEGFTRWANTNLTIADKDDAEIISLATAPAKFSWTSYEAVPLPAYQR